MCQVSSLTRVDPLARVYGECLPGRQGLLSPVGAKPSACTDHVGWIFSPAAKRDSCYKEGSLQSQSMLISKENAWLSDILAMHLQKKEKKCKITYMSVEAVFLFTYKRKLLHHCHRVAFHLHRYQDNLR